MRIIIISTIILLQFFAIGYLGITILEKRESKKVFFASILKKEDFVFDKRSELKYFVEPLPDNFMWARSELLDVVYKYEINADTLNERYDYKIQKQEDTYRIVAIGDSFTFGMFVPTDKNWTELLEDLLNSELQCSNYKKFEIINLGMPGYDIQYAAHRFNIRGAKYNPDLVLWFYIKNDFDEINEWIGPQIKYAQYTQKGFPEGYEKLMQELAKESGVEKMTAYQEKALASITSKFTKSLLLFSTPILKQAESIDNIQIIKKFIESRPETFLYIIPSNLLKLGALFPDGHPNIKGHSIIAEDLFSYLTENEMIPCAYTKK